MNPKARHNEDRKDKSGIREDRAYGGRVSWDRRCFDWTDNQGFYEVYNELGFGFLESVYCRAMGIALLQSRLHVASEVAVPVSFRGELVGVFRADLLVEKRVILELKTAENISKAHEAQLLHYLRASEIEVGLILNFGELAKFRRIEFRNERKRSVASDALIPSLSL